MLTPNEKPSECPRKALYEYKPLTVTTTSTIGELRGSRSSNIKLKNKKT